MAANQSEGAKLFIKVVFTGPAGAGKTAMNSILTHVGDPSLPAATVSGSCSTLNYKRDQYDIEVELWDTAGSERYRALNGMYFRNARGVIAVYDISDSKSFNTMQEYVSDCVAETESDSPNDLIVVVAGNKCDLTRVRQVSQEEGQEYSATHNYNFIECSAKMNKNVDAIMDKILEKMLESPEKYIVEETRRNLMDDIPNDDNKKKCC